MVHKPIAFLTEKNIANIVDCKIRNDVRKYIDKHPSDKIADALQQYGKEHNIKRVRCKTKNQTPVSFGKGARQRFLDVEDYFAAIIWQIPPKQKGKKPSYAASYIRRVDISQDGKILNTKKPHDAAKKIGIVHKNDYLEFFEGNRWHKCRIAGLKNPDRLDIRPICATNKVADWITSTQDKMLDRYWRPSLSEHYYIAVNTLFGRLRARLITVDPIGKVSVKK